MQRHTLALILLFVGSVLRAEDIRFPASAGAVDVTKEPYLATGDGKTDDTAALQKAIDTNKRQFATLYLPNGTYLVRGTLSYGADRELAKHLVIQGQSQKGTVIRLADKAEGFGDANRPQPVLTTFAGESTGMAFTNSVFNLTIEVGAGNPGATALQFIGNNQAIVEDVTLRSADPARAGRAGLDFRAQWPGPCLVKNVTIDGFDTGVWSPNHWDYAVWFEGLTLRNQRAFGIDIAHMFMGFRKLTSVNAVPALRITEDAYCSIHDSTFSGGDPKGAAFVGNPPNLLRNVTAKGYGRLAERDGKPLIPALAVKEWASAKPVSLNPGKPGMLGLPVVETPATPWGDPADWVVAEPGGSDQLQAAIDRAAQEKKAVVCLARGSWGFTRTVRIHGSVRRITGMFNLLRVEQPLLGSSDPLFRVETPDDATVFIDRIAWMEAGGQGAPWFVVEQAGNGAVVFKDLAISGQAYRSVPGKKGTVFIEDVVGEGFNFSPGQKVFAHYVNPEGNAPIRMIDNDGADLWIFGMKHEVANTIITTRNRGRTELLAGNVYPSQPNGIDLPAFIVEDATFTGSWQEACGDRYEVFVKATRKGVSKELHKRDLPDGRRVPLFTEAP